MAELADAADSKSADLRVLGVRLPLPAPYVQISFFIACIFTQAIAPKCFGRTTCAAQSYTRTPKHQHLVTPYREFSVSTSVNIDRFPLNPLRIDS